MFNIDDRGFSALAMIYSFARLFDLIGHSYWLLFVQFSFNCLRRKLGTLT